MCGFSGSKDEYRFTPEEFQQMLPALQKEGVDHVRFTGGEPLLHAGLSTLLHQAKSHGIKTSVITNGLLLEKRASELAEAGLNQIIVSIDGLEATHDILRGIKGIFQFCAKGLLAAKENGIRLRVNSVVGPRNYLDMPELQVVLTKMGVEQWEMSSLKLGKRLDYSDEDRSRIENIVIPKIFNEGAKRNLLVPFGKTWCGDSQKERDLYFQTGITPRPEGICEIVNFVRYYDPKNKRLYACSLIPHREESEKRFPAIVESAGSFSTEADDIEKQAGFFHKQGPYRCTGCSSTAAGLSNQVKAGMKLHDWSY